MNLSHISKSLAALCLAMVVGTSANAQSPTSLAENSDEYYAYVYSYSAMVYSGGIASVMSGNSVEADTAQFVDELVTDGFLLCYDALVEDDDTLWQDAADKLSLARFWTNTLIVFAEDSQSSTTVNNIRTLQRYLDIAIDNAEDAAPQQKRLWMPVYTRF